MYKGYVPSYRFIEAVEVSEPYKNKKTLRALRRELKRLGGVKPKSLPSLFYHPTGAQLDWDKKNIEWIYVPVKLNAVKEYSIKAVTGEISMPIEDESILELILEDLLSKYNIERIIEEQLAVAIVDER